MTWTQTYEWKVLFFYGDKYYDGDSFWLEIDRGFYDRSVISCRLLDCDTWEIRKPRDIDDPAEIEEHKRKGLLAKKYTADWFYRHLKAGHTIWVRTHRDGITDSFGQVLVEVFSENEVLADLLKANGHTKE